MIGGKPFAGTAFAITPQGVLLTNRHNVRSENGKDTTVHGCPGYELAMGVMLAMIASLMKSGTLRPTGSPVLLILTQPAQQ